MFSTSKTVVLKSTSYLNSLPPQPNLERYHFVFRAFSLGLRRCNHLLANVNILWKAFEVAAGRLSSFLHCCTSSIYSDNM